MYLPARICIKPITTRFGILVIFKKPKTPLPNWFIASNDAGNRKYVGFYRVIPGLYLSGF